MDDYQFLFTPQPEPEPDRNGTLEMVARYATFFCLGVFVAHLVRIFAELQPLFWILALAGLAWLVYAIRVQRSVKLMGIAAILVAALIAGYWDGLVHGIGQGVSNLEKEVTQ